MFSKAWYTVRFSTIPAGLPGLYHLVTVLPFSYLLRKPSTIRSETSKVKNWETGVLGTRKKIETGECYCVTRVQFWSEKLFFDIQLWAFVVTPDLVCCLLNKTLSSLRMPMQVQKTFFRHTRVTLLGRSSFWSAYSSMTSAQLGKRRRVNTFELEHVLCHKTVAGLWCQNGACANTTKFTRFWVAVQSFCGSRLVASQDGFHWNLNTMT